MTTDTFAETKRPDTSEIGATGTTFFSGSLAENEYNTDLRGAKGRGIYDKMRRSDSRVKAALMVCELPIRAAEWGIEPPSEEARDVEIAEALEKNLFEGMSITWDSFIHHALLMLPFGFMSFEKVWKVDDEGIRFAKLAPRLPSSLYRWILDDNGGLLGIEQYVQVGGTFQFKSIPVDKLLVFTNEKEGSNFEGMSILRTAYKHWFYKDQLYRIDGIAAERHALGIPALTLPMGASDEDKAKAESFLSHIYAHEKQWVRLVEGQTFTVEGLSGTVRDIMPSIQHHDKKIAECVLADFLDLGGSDSGSWALSKDKTTFFLLSLKAVAKNIEDTVNEYAIKPWVDYNYADVKEYPKLTCGKLETRDIEKYVAAVSGLITSGGLTPDRDTENTLREALELPELPEDVPTASEAKAEAAAALAKAQAERPVVQPVPPGQPTAQPSKQPPTKLDAESWANWDAEHAGKGGSAPRGGGGVSSDAGESTGGNQGGSEHMKWTTYKKIPVAPHSIDDYQRDKSLLVDDILQHIPEGEFTAIGMRGIYAQELGKTTLRNSYESPEGVRGRRLSGTSSLIISGDWYGDSSSVIERNADKALAQIGHYGNTDYVAIIKGELMTDEIFNDPNEAVLSNAKTVFYIRKNTDEPKKLSERQKTKAEECVNFAEIDETLNRAEVTISQAVKAVQQKQVAKLVEVAMNLVQKCDFKRLPDIDVPFRAEVAAAIEKELLGVYEYGRGQVRQELAKQCVSLAEPWPEPLSPDQVNLIKAFLAARSKATANQMAAKVKNAIVFNGMNQIRQGTALRAAMEEAVAGLSEKELLTAVANVVPEAFGFGRSSQAEEMKEDIGSVQYSALLDAMTCEECAPLDGEEWGYSDPRTDEYARGNPRCQGRGRCRCLEVYISKQERRNPNG